VQSNNTILSTKIAKNVLKYKLNTNVLHFLTIFNPSLLMDIYINYHLFHSNGVILELSVDVCATVGCCKYTRTSSTEFTISVFHCIQPPWRWCCTDRNIHKGHNKQKPFVIDCAIFLDYIQEGNKLQRQKILSLIYPIYNHNWRNISTIYLYNKISIKRNILTIKQNTSVSRSSWGLISTPV
jgi:hypothetical protein